MNTFIYKIIDDRGGGTGTPSEPENMGEPKEESPIASALSAGNKSIVTLATMKKIGSTVMSFAGSHIATYTGSTALQNRINAGAQLVGTAISIVENPAMGLISLALDMAQRALEIAEEKRQDNIRVNEARKRAGTSLNSSRSE